MFVGELAMFVSRSCVLLRLFVLAEIVKMSRLEMMMRSRLVVSVAIVFVVTVAKLATR